MHDWLGQVLEPLTGTMRLPDGLSLGRGVTDGGKTEEEWRDLTTPRIEFSGYLGTQSQEKPTRHFILDSRPMVRLERRQRDGQWGHPATLPNGGH